MLVPERFAFQWVIALFDICVFRFVRFASRLLRRHILNAARSATGIFSLLHAPAVSIRIHAQSLAALSATFERSPDGPFRADPLD